jgi:tRNA(fMet)-specific endonuclease VapC
MYILDTDTCIFWLKGSLNIGEKVKKQGFEEVFVTIITACELYFGAYNSQRKSDNISSLDELFKLIAVIQTTPEVAKVFGENKARLKKEGNIINDADILIASIVMVNNGILITNNITHFERISGLTLENWLP